MTMINWKSEDYSDDDVDDSMDQYFGKKECFTWEKELARSFHQTRQHNIIKIVLSALQGPQLLPQEIKQLLEKYGIFLLPPKFYNRELRVLNPYSFRAIVFQSFCTEV